MPDSLPSPTYAFVCDVYGPVCGVGPHVEVRGRSLLLNSKVCPGSASLPDVGTLGLWMSPGYSNSGSHAAGQMYRMKER